MPPDAAEPVITVAVSDALARIEAKVDSIGQQLVAKADMALVHDIDNRLRVVETQQIALKAAHEAVDKARGRQWTAIALIATVVGAATAVFGLVLSHLHP